VTLVSLSPPHCYNQSHAEKSRDEEGKTGDFGVALSSTVLALRSCVDAPPRAHRTYQCEG
jgi:hypothetical protein